MTNSFDLVVIGAGAIGSSVALAAARAGWSVAIVDRHPQPGHGSTSASAGIIRVHATDVASCILADESLPAWTDWRGYTETPRDDPVAEFSRCGSMILDDGTGFTTRVSATMVEAQVAHDWLHDDQLCDALPFMDLGRFGPPRSMEDGRFWDGPVGMINTAVHTPGSGYCADPALAAQNLAAAAVRAGVQAVMRAQVIGIERASGRLTGVSLADGRTLPCRAALNAAGPHSAQINALAKVGSDFRVTLRRVREELHVVPAPPEIDFEKVGMHIVDGDLGTNFRPEGGNNILMGGNGAATDPVEIVGDPDHFNHNPTLAAWERQTLRLARRIPALRIPPRPVGLAGLYDVTDDWLPVYDRTELEGFFVAIGTSGNQFKTAPVVGPLMHALIAYCMDGNDHDAQPLAFPALYSDRVIDTGAFSRMRVPTTGGSRG